jgi:holo-[acyl-carrier protein] synthase
MIYGIGTDFVEVPRIEKILQKWGEKFTGRVYSKGEIDYCHNKAFPAMHFAARFVFSEISWHWIGHGGKIKRR